jgi:hypothetical protein
MNCDDLNNKIKKEFERFQDFWQSNEWWGAILILSSIYNCISSVLTPMKLKNIWLPKIMKPFLSDEIIESLNNTYAKKYQRIERIISIGDRFNDDEFLLIFTCHAELCLIKEYLEAREVNCIHLNLFQIEEKAKSFGKIKVNQKDYNKALSQIQKNWGLPVATVWTV